MSQSLVLAVAIVILCDGIDVRVEIRPTPRGAAVLATIGDDFRRRMLPESAKRCVSRSFSSTSTEGYRALRGRLEEWSRPEYGPIRTHYVDAHASCMLRYRLKTKGGWTAWIDVPPYTPEQEELWSLLSPIYPRSAMAIMDIAFIECLDSLAESQVTSPPP